MSNSFYKLFEKIQNFKEQNEMDTTSDKVMQPSITNQDDSSIPDNMQLGVKNNISGEMEDQNIQDTDETDDTDNLSVPEGDVDIDSLVASLNKIKKLIPKFETMDKDKADQLDDLIKQTTNLISSFSDETEEGSTEDTEGEEKNSEDLVGDKAPSFGDDQGPPIKQTGDENKVKDMSLEMPSISPADQNQEM